MAPNGTLVVCLIITRCLFSRPARACLPSSASRSTTMLSSPGFLSRVLHKISQGSRASSVPGLEGCSPGKSIAIKDPRFAQTLLHSLRLPNFADESPFLHAASDEHLSRHSDQLCCAKVEMPATQTVEGRRAHVVLVYRLRGILGDVIGIDPDHHRLASRVHLRRATRKGRR